ncbi:hypothetical protein Hdeb2414_s0020g00554611 [Helianthus debilis subsp. tardiflorus]
MKKGSNGSGNSAPKAVATTGYAVISPVPVTTTTVSSGGKGSYQTKSQYSYGDKQTGSYGRATTTEKASAGDFQWKNGTTGTRSEYTQSSTVRVGDKSGYTEVRSEQSVRNVRYNNSSSSNKSSGHYGGPYIVYGDPEY